MSNQLTVFIIDDNIPKIPEYVDKLVYGSKISSTLLFHLVSTCDWKGEYNLKQLTSDILLSKHAQSNNLITYGFAHPSICLDEIDNGLKPDIIIFDWEYGSESYKDSSNWLLELLKLSNAFIFVYSQVRNEIPVFLNKNEYDKYADRFQLFLKGDSENFIFSSEEYILQYIVTRLSKSNKIKIHGIDIDFQENGYLKNPTDILYIEKIIGRTLLINKLKTKNYSITDSNIEQLLSESKGIILFDSNRKFLITPDSTLLIDKFHPDKELTYLQVLKEFGLFHLQEVLEVGFAKV